MRRRTYSEVIGSCGNSPAPTRNTTAMERAGRNEPCPCGSGRKYKKCCLPQESVRARFGALIETSALPLLSRLARFAETSAGRSLESVARDEFPFWRGRLTRRRERGSSTF